MYKQLSCSQNMLSLATSMYKQHYCSCNQPAACPSST
jgi:hypothetical protein